MEIRPSSPHNIDYTSQPTAPIIRCRCCGQFAEPLWQAGSSRRAGCWLLTCLNPDCALVGYTFSTGGYNDLDLTPYLESARKHH